MYWYIRLEWKRPHEECKDLTQAFFAELLRRDVFKHADPARGTFRAFLKAVLKHFLLVARRDERRLKRGGGRSPIAIDMEEPLPPSKGLTPDQTFDREWSRAILEAAYRRLEEETRKDGQEQPYRAFRAYYVDAAPGAEPSYKEIAKKLGVTEFTLQNHLYAMRQKLKKLIRELVTDAARSPADVESELRELLLDGDS